MPNIRQLTFKSVVLGDPAETIDSAIFWWDPAETIDSARHRDIKKLKKVVRAISINTKIDGFSSSNILPNPSILVFCLRLGTPSILVIPETVKNTSIGILVEPSILVPPWGAIPDRYE